MSTQLSLDGGSAQSTVDDESSVASRPSARRRPGVASAVFDRHYSDARRKTRREYAWTIDDKGKSIPKSPKRFEVRYVDTAGKQRFERFESRANATARHGELVEQFRSGSFIEAERARVTVRAVADTYVQTLTAKSASTRSSYGAIVEVFCREFGDREVGSLVVSDVNKWISDQLDADRSLTSIRKYVAVVRLLLDTAVDDRQIRANPARSAKVPTKDRRTVVSESRRTAKDYLIPDRFAELLQGDVIAAPTSLMLRFQYLTGLRIGEVCELRRKDVENVLDNGYEVTVINVRRSAVETKGGLVIGQTKSGRDRQVPLSDAAAGVLREALEALSERLPDWKGPDPRRVNAADARDFNSLLDYIHGEHLLFPTARGKHHRGSNVNRVLANACMAAGVDKVTTHDLRHAWTSNALANGTSTTVAAELLGHVDASLVHRVYGHTGGLQGLISATRSTRSV